MYFGAPVDDFTFFALGFGSEGLRVGGCTLPLRTSRLAWRKERATWVAIGF